MGENITTGTDWFRPFHQGSPVGALQAELRRRASIFELRNDPKIAQRVPDAAWPCRYAPSHPLPVDRFYFHQAQH
jgi:hypothetical protein